MVRLAAVMYWPTRRIWHVALKSTHLDAHRLAFSTLPA